MKKICTICWLFDSGRIENAFYGKEVFSRLFEQKCLFENKGEMVFFTGDIIDENIASDCAQIAIRDEMCTIENLPEESKDLPYAIVVEGIEEEIAHKVDRALCDYEAYYGMTRIDISSTDTRRQFWKNLVRLFSMLKTEITVLGPEEEGFIYKDIAEKQGLKVHFDESDESHIIIETPENLGGEQSKAFKKKTNSVRGRREMNFALVKEVEIAGAQIWRSIKDLDRVNIKKDRRAEENNIGYLFLAFYQAAQGIERLQKILIELIIKVYPPKEKELKDVEKMLRNHNHNNLNDFIEKKTGTCIRRSEKHFLDILMRFYKEARYGRYSFSNDNERETTLLHELGKSLPEKEYDRNIKKHFGKYLAYLSNYYYDLIRDLSRGSNLHVYEINAHSDAGYVFHNKDKKSLYQLYKEIEQSKKELLYYIMLKGKELIPNTLSDHYSALDFDIAYVPHYILTLISDCDSVSDLYDYVDCEYDDMAENDKRAWEERFDAIQNIDRIVATSEEMNV